MPTRHAILGPSSASRWLACTPSARFEEQIQEEESIFALEGTLAHDLAALILSSRAGIFKGSPEHFNEELSKVEIKVINFYIKEGNSLNDAQNLYYKMLEYAEEWAELVKSNGGDIFIEQEYDISTYVPLGFGTADATNITSEVLYVSDLKYGAGVAISATANKQMMLYGVGALVKAVELGHKPETVILTIFQPRAGGVSTWQISVAELLKWAELEVRPKALLAISGQGDFIAGKHCQFCKARTSCKAYFDKFQNAKDIQDRRVMTDKDRIFVLTNGSLLKTWITKIEEEAIKTLSGRGKIPGFKLVAGKGRRQFKNEDDVVDILIGEGFESDQIFTSSLRSLTDLEKSIGAKRFKEILSDYIISIDGKPQLAPIDDERPSINSSAADEYDNIN